MTLDDFALEYLRYLGAEPKEEVSPYNRMTAKLIRLARAKVDCNDQGR